MKLAFDHIFAGVTLLILSGFLGLYWLETANLHHNRSHIDAINANFDTKMPVLVVPSLSNDSDIQTQLLNGDAAFLFLPNPSNNSPVVTDILARTIFLGGTDYLLNPALFNQLFVGQFLMHGKSFVQRKINDTEIRAITIYRKPTLLMSADHPNFSPQIGEAIMSNNSRHAIYLVYLSSNYFVE